MFLYLRNIFIIVTKDGIIEKFNGENIDQIKIFVKKYLSHTLKQFLKYVVGLIQAKIN